MKQLITHNHTPHMTLLNINEFSIEQVIDEALRRLKKQNDFSTDSAGNCMYRGSGGRACAVGLLIPDNIFHPSMEGSVFSLCALPKFRHVRDDIRNVLGELQGLHDNASRDCRELSFTEKLRAQITRISGDRGTISKLLVERFDVIFGTT